MFGNPYLSSTPVDDRLFQSQADTYGNSFANPINPANMNPGWGIDPSLLSPSYTAGFRPQYSGPTNNSFYGRPGLMQSIGALSPVAPDVMWGDPFMHQQPYIDSASSRPYDSTMWAAQRIGAPVAAFWAAGKLMGGYNGMGMARGAYSVGQRFGQNLGGGFARGLGLPNVSGRLSGAPGIGRAAGAIAARQGALGAVAGGAFGVAAGYGLPLMAVQGAMWGAEKTMFNPYINSRRTAEDLRESFSGITFGEAGGNAIHGGGLGGFQSANMANDITRQGINDMTFSAGQYAAGASMISRSGLLDNAQSGNITQRVKDSMTQVKLIMSIAAMPEMKDAVEQLAKLGQMGASTLGGGFSNASMMMSNMGKFASIAGSNVQRIMNTVGVQGEYLYQSNGMTGYMGQLAAAGSYASLSAAKRMGLIGSAQISRMGGLDGGTQASLTGQINVSQTLYNKMSNFNSFLGQGNAGNMIGNINRFGQNMSQDPMGTYGSVLLHGRQMAGVQMAARGTLAVEDQLSQIVENMPWLKGADGRISIERAAPILMQMGMSEDQIHAYAAERMSELDPKARGLKMRGLDADLAKQQRQYISQNGIYGGALGGSVYSLRKTGRNITTAVSDALINPITASQGGFTDSVQSAVDWLWYGTTVAASGRENVEDLISGRVPAKQGPANIFDMETLLDGKRPRGESAFIRHAEVAKRMNQYFREGDEDARLYFGATSADDRKKHLSSFINSGKMGRKETEWLKSYRGREGLDEFLESRQRDSSLNERGDWRERMDRSFNEYFFGSNKEPKVDQFRNELSRVSGISSGESFDKLATVGVAYNIAARMQRGEITVDNLDELMRSDTELQRFAKLTGKTGMALMRAADETTVRASGVGLVGAGVVAAGLDGSKYKTDEDRLRATANINGGAFHRGGLKNAADLETSEVVGYELSAQQDAKQRLDIETKYRNGRVDFSGYQSTVNSLDQKKAIDKFAKAVDKFADKVEGKGGSAATKDGVPSLWSAAGMQKLFGGGNQKDQSGTAGNK